MIKTIKVYLHKSKKDESSGYIYIQSIENRKKSYSSLGLPKLNEKFWDANNQRVRKYKDIDYASYNQHIENKITELLANNKDIVQLDTVKTRKSFLLFFNSIIENKLISKHGTRIKYKSVYNRIKEYQKTLKKDDLLFSALTLDFIEGFQEYLKRTGLDTNSATHYLKIIKSIVRKAQKVEEFYNIKDPFVNFSFERKEKKTKETLNKEEIQLIKNSPIVGRLEKDRNLFLFQFFTNGMRVSDLVTLRFNNLSHGRINYKMFKTRNEMNVPISETHIELLSYFIPFHSKLNTTIIGEAYDRTMLSDIVERRKKKYTPKQKKPSPISIPSAEPHLPFIVDIEKSFDYGHLKYDEYLIILNSMVYDELKFELSRLLKFLAGKGILQLHKSYYLDFSKEYLKVENELQKYVDFITNRLAEIRIKYFKDILNELHQLSISPKTKNLFVFKMLKDIEFINVDEKNDFTQISIHQYKKIHKSSVVYNRHLKEIQKILDIKKSLRTHMPRISFTNIMMKMDGINHYDISKSLGHSSVSITDEYLNTGFDSGREDEVQKKLGEQFK